MTKLKFHPDYKDFIELLETHGVDYLIVGGWAYGIHARPRYTKDIDVWFRKDSDTATRMLKVLSDFGFGNLKPPITHETLMSDQIIQLGYEPIRIDLFNHMEGLDFQAVWPKRKELAFDDTTINFVDRESLIHAKRIADRPRDREDVRMLEETRPALEQSRQPGRHEKRHTRKKGHGHGFDM